MQFQVNPMHQTQENGQKPSFWLFGSLKKAFLRFLNDPQWVVRWPTHSHHSILSEYAISSQGDAPYEIKWPITSFLATWIIQKGIFEFFE